MKHLDSLNINYNSSVQVILFEALPLILIMVALFVVAVKFIKKNIIDYSYFRTWIYSTYNFQRRTAAVTIIKDIKNIDKITKL